MSGRCFCLAMSFSFLPAQLLTVQFRPELLFSIWDGCTMVFDTVDCFKIFASFFYYLLVHKQWKGSFFVADIRCTFIIICEMIKKIDLITFFLHSFEMNWWMLIEISENFSSKNTEVVYMYRIDLYKAIFGLISTRI